MNLTFQYSITSTDWPYINSLPKPAAAAGYVYQHMPITYDLYYYLLLNKSMENSPWTPYQQKMRDQIKEKFLKVRKLQNTFLLQSAIYQGKCKLYFRLMSILTLSM